MFFKTGYFINKDTSYAKPDQNQHIYKSQQRQLIVKNKKQHKKKLAS